MMEKIENNGFIKYCGIKIIDIDEGIFEMPVVDYHLNPYGFVHGGALYTLADTAMGLSLRSVGNYVTINASINYLKPATGKLLKTQIEKIKIGKEVATLTCNIYDENDNLLCISTGTYHIKK